MIFFLTWTLAGIGYFLYKLYGSVSVTHLTELLTIECPVAQWLEHPTRSWRVVGSNPIWDSDFFPSPHFSLHLISFLFLFHLKQYLLTVNNLKYNTS